MIASFIIMNMQSPDNRDASIGLAFMKPIDIGYVREYFPGNS